MNDKSGIDETIEKTATDARQGVTTGRVRWMLVISTGAVVVALAIVYWAVIG